MRKYLWNWLIRADVGRVWRERLEKDLFCYKLSILERTQWMRSPRKTWTT
jgi:hypothetical protein